MTCPHCNTPVCGGFCNCDDEEPRPVVAHLITEDGLYLVGTRLAFLKRGMYVDARPHKPGTEPVVYRAEVTSLS